MNKNVKARVKTPLGETKEFPLKEIVRQGTIMGPPLCGVSTDRINRIEEDRTEFKVSQVKIE